MLLSFCEQTHALNPIKFVCTCIYWLLQNKEFYQVVMHLLYFINLKHFQTLKWCTWCYSFIYYDCNVLHSEIDIFDLDTTTVHDGCLNSSLWKITVPAVCFFTNKKGRFMEEPTQTLLHLYLSEIKITLIVLFRIKIIDARYTLLSLSLGQKLSRI